MAIHLITGRLFLSDALHARGDYLETPSECRLSQQRRWTNIKSTIGVCPVFTDCFCQMALPPNSGILPPNLTLEELIFFMKTLDTKGFFQFEIIINCLS